MYIHLCWSICIYTCIHMHIQSHNCDYIYVHVYVYSIKVYNDFRQYCVIGVTHAHQCILCNSVLSHSAIISQCSYSNVWDLTLNLLEYDNCNTRVVFFNVVICNFNTCIVFINHVSGNCNTSIVFFNVVNCDFNTCIVFINPISGNCNTR